ncbi:MAG: hypothetical protein HZA80_01675 [Candidatus Taylorbacteria bacterium]|nr:hypothetical protein [Candidatus Taylorbacteria bacterium]
MRKKAAQYPTPWYMSWWVWGGLMTLIIGSLFFRPVWRMYQYRATQKTAAHVEMLYRGYVDMGQYGTWWLENMPPANKASFDLYTSKKVEIQQLLAKYAKATPETEKIYERFKDFRVGVAQGNQGSDLIAPHENVDMVRSNGLVRFFFFTKADLGVVARIDTPMWRTDLSAVVCPARNFDEVIFAGTLFHELGHALRHNRENGIAVPGPDSPNRWLEEMDMHRVTSSVIEFAHPGYYDLIRKMVKKYPASSIERLLQQIQPADIQTVDTHLGRRLSRIDRDTLFLSILTDLATEWCSAHGQSDTERANFYRWIQLNYATPPPGK